MALGAVAPRADGRVRARLRGRAQPARRHGRARRGDADRRAARRAAQVGPPRTSTPSAAGAVARASSALSAGKSAQSDLSGVRGGQLIAEVRGRSTEQETTYARAKQ